MEFDWGFKNPGPKTQKYEEEVSSFFYSQNINPYICRKLPEYLMQVPQLTNVQVKEKSCGLGEWDGQLGEM
ncbi:7442_t:CDS:2, partial [Acaulospora morrowiae]